MSHCLIENVTGAGGCLESLPNINTRQLFDALCVRFLAASASSSTDACCIV